MKKITLIILMCCCSFMYGQELLTNSTFDSDLSGWTASGNVTWAADPVISCGSEVAVFSGGNTPITGVLSQNFSATAGATLTLSTIFFGDWTCAAPARARIDIIDNTSATVIQTYTVSHSASSECSDIGTFSGSFTATSGDLQVVITDTSPGTLSCDFDLDSLSITDTTPIPTLSQWGLIVLGLSLLIFGTLAIRRRAAFVNMA